ncbi:2,3-diaminopropionate biosynthesis protein SbnB [Streptomyces sp. SL13]|uniref:2,3-diaminopropionate biosynthesis protein SbnB n=1 Tax=Streptantibioticus silvisoli TaxID=2705255 RepID=A0AA90K943_9ACTN|nr:2,3-diaminopropionate biosynthesis protein SbnB [Streptantibioticus silvisoli]MDI5970648.1 2,3-diaminopropionate biosynthesis protein SbnB [Streptantibioticus silvisoli]
MSTFHVIGGKVTQDVIAASPSRILEIVRETYLRHSAGETVNPNSYFLRFPDRPSCRIIALPAHIGGDQPVSGIKWIASYPPNIERNLQRASAVLLLNDAETGYPFACLEASQISAARTAASAALAVETLSEGDRPRKVLFVGAGVIGRTVSDFLAARGLSVDECMVHDHVDGYARTFASYVSDTHGWNARHVPDVDCALAAADLVVLATTAPAPWLCDEQILRPGQLILNLSLRDIHPTVMIKCNNVLDDLDHCLTAQTSPHLTEIEYGSRDFVNGTLADVLRGEATLNADRATIFSPFGLGVLDLAVGCHVYQSALEQEQATEIPGFFPELSRW